MRLWRKPLDIEKFRIPTGKVFIISDRCKGCEFCIHFCPKEVLEVSSGFNQKGCHPPEVREGAHCIACGLCELICPEFAIFVEKEEGGGDVKQAH